MNSNFIASSMKRRKRQEEDQNDLIVKKSKLVLSSTAISNNNVNKPSGQVNILTSDKQTTCKPKNIDLVSLISCEYKKKIDIYPGQIVWSRCNKSPFWPSIVWRTKAGKPMNENDQVLVKCFAKKGGIVWIKMENIFPFDGVESFKKMKNSLNMNAMTLILKRDFNFAFNASNELWPRAVAEAMFCMSKPDDERLNFFLILLQMDGCLNVLGELITSSSKKRSKKFQNDKNVDKSYSSLKDFRINEEFERITSYFKNVDSGNCREVKENKLPESTSLAIPTFEAEKTYQENVKDLRKIDEEFLTFVMKSREKNTLYDDIGWGIKCKICYAKQNNTEILLECSGTCNGYMHEKCFDNNSTHRHRCLTNTDLDRKLENLLCCECDEQSKSLCFVCKTEDLSQSKPIKCSISGCSRHYHVNCVKDWPQAKFIESSNQILCPSHECHNCTLDGHSMDNDAKLTTCVKCQATLHVSPYCIQAGTIMLTENQHICITHRKLALMTWQTNFCHICYEEGGVLLHCTTCLQLFHEDCSHLASTTDNTCSDGLNGRHPVYGDIVFAKMYVLRWPAIIVPPRCIPSQMKNAPHREHDLCVRFFEERKLKWIRREYVYPFDERDLITLSQSHNNPKFKQAMLSATKWFRKMKLNKENQFASDNKICPMPYEKIMENNFVSPAKLVIRKNSEAVECECDINDEDPCGPTSNCINRMTYIECDDLCPCDSKCGNKCIQLRMYAKVDLKFFGDKGFGLISSEKIAAGSFVIDYVGEVITELEYERRINDKKRRNCYVMKYTKGLFIDAELKGNLSRFINHSCNPNCKYEIWTSNGVNQVAVVANIDIPRDTEITCTYQWSQNTPCLCNEPNCATLL